MTTYSTAALTFATQRRISCQRMAEAFAWARGARAQVTR